MLRVSDSVAMRGDGKVVVDVTADTLDICQSYNEPGAVGTIVFRCGSTQLHAVAGTNYRISSKKPNLKPLGPKAHKNRVVGSQKSFRA